MTELLIPLELVVVNNFGVLYDVVRGNWISFSARDKFGTRTADKFRLVMQNSGSNDITTRIVKHRQKSAHIAYYFKNDVALWVNDNIKPVTFDSIDGKDARTAKTAHLAANFSSENDALLFKMRWL